MFKKIKKIILSYISKLSGSKVYEKPEQKQEDSIVDANFVPESQQKPVQNPLKPFWKEFDNTYNEQYWLKKFESEGRPFNPEQYKETFHKYVSLRNFLGPSKRGYLYKMWKDAEYLKTVFEPLTKMGILYTLDLTGGSVRDFVLNNHDKIKDLDFMVSIQGQYIKYDSIKEQFTDEQLAAVGCESSLSEEEIKVKLIQLCFLAANENIISYDHVDKRSKVVGHDNYHGDIFKKDRLMAVFKTDGKKTYYPIDILMTDFVKPVFIEGFDFDICKASICFINPYVDIPKEFPKDFTHLISRFVADIEFWADVYNKTITYNTVDRDTYHVDGSYDKHYPRIKKKYPDYRLLVVGDGDVKSYFDSRVLNDILSKNEDRDQKKRMKI